MIPSQPLRDTALLRRELFYGTLGYLYLAAVAGAALLFAGLGVHWGVWMLVVLPLFFLLEMARALLAAIPAPEGVPVTREQHPRLFRAIDRARGALRAPQVDVVLVTPDMNAAVLERPALGVVGPARRWLILGLPLLHAVPEDELRAILAHEFAHLARGDGRSKRWLVRVAAGWELLVQSLQVRRSLARPVFLPFLRWYAPRLETLLATGSRAHELGSDRLAARVAGAETAARALVRLAVRERHAASELVPACLRETRAREDLPEDAFARLLAGLRAPLDEARSSAVLAGVLCDRTLDEHSHPCLADRLEALGAARAADGWAAALQRDAGAPAAAVLLDPAAAAELESAVGEWWRGWAGGVWAQCRRDVRTMEEAEAAPSEASAWAAARWASVCEPPRVAIPHLRGFLAVHADHREARLALGTLLLDGGSPGDEAEGARLLESLAAEESTSALAAAEALQEHHARAGAPREAARCRRRAVQLRHAAMRALAEVTTLDASDTLRPLALTASERVSIEAELDTRPLVRAAYLVEKRSRALPDSPVAALAVEVAVPWYRYSSGRATHQLCEELVPLIPVPHQADRLVVSVERRSGLHRRLRRLPGAEVYRRGVAASALPAPSAWSAPTVRDRIGFAHLYAGGVLLVLVGAMGLAWFTTRDDRAERRVRREAAALLQERRWAEADSVLLGAVRLGSADAWAHAGIGYARLRMDRCQEALPHIRRSLALAPEKPYAHQTLGACLRRLGRHAEAEGAYREAIRLRPDKPMAHVELGWTLLALDRADEAEREFRRTLELDPDFLEARRELALLRSRRGELREAEAEIDALVRRFPGDAILWADAGYLAYLSDDHVGAADAFSEAARLDPAYFQVEHERRRMWDDAQRRLGSPPAP